MSNIYNLKNKEELRKKMIYDLDRSIETGKINIEKYKSSKNIDFIRHKKMIDALKLLRRIRKELTNMKDLDCALNDNAKKMFEDMKK